MTGTYQWDASYAADGNNNAVSDNGNTNEQVTVESGQPHAEHQPQPNQRHTEQRHAAGPHGHGHAGGRVLRDRHDHLHAVLRRQRGGHGDGGGQRQRQLRDAHRLHPAHHGHGRRDLPVGRQLRPRRQQQRRQRQQQRQRAGDGQQSLVEREHGDRRRGDDSADQRQPAAGDVGLRHGNGDRRPDRAHGHGDLLLLRHGDPGISHDRAGQHAGGDAERRPRAQFDGYGGLAGRQLLLHRRLQR